MFGRFKQIGFFGFIDSTERALLGAAVLAVNFIQAASQELRNTINSTNTTSLAPTMAPTHTRAPTLSEFDREMNMVVLGVTLGLPIAAISLIALCIRSSSRNSDNNYQVLQTVVAVEATNTCCDALLNNSRR